VLLSDDKGFHLIFCDLFYFIILDPYMENVDNSLAFGTGQSRSQQCIVMGLLGTRRMYKVRYDPTKDQGICEITLRRNMEDDGPTGELREVRQETDKRW